MFSKFVVAYSSAFLIFLYPILICFCDPLISIINNFILESKCLEKLLLSNMLNIIDDFKSRWILVSIGIRKDILWRNKQCLKLKWNNNWMLPFRKWQIQHKYEILFWFLKWNKYDSWNLKIEPSNILIILSITLGILRRRTTILSTVSFFHISSYCLLLSCYKIGRLLALRLKDNWKFNEDWGG